MAFVKLNKAPGFHSRLISPYEIRMGAHLQSAVNKTRGVYFGITPRVVEDVGWTIAETDTRKVLHVMLHEGVGEDAGFLMLVEDNDGYALGTVNKSGKSFSMSIAMMKFKHYVLNEVPVPPAPVEFTIDKEEKIILVQCPDWLRYNSLSYQEPEKPKPEVRGTQRVPPTEDKGVEPIHLNRTARRRVAAKIAHSLR